MSGYALVFVFACLFVVSGDVEDVEADEETGGEEADTEQHVAVHQREVRLVVPLTLVLLLLTVTCQTAALYNHRN